MKKTDIIKELNRAIDGAKANLNPLHATKDGVLTHRRKAPSVLTQALYQAIRLPPVSEHPSFKDFRLMVLKSVDADLRFTNVPVPQIEGVLKALSPSTKSTK